MTLTARQKIFLELFGISLLAFLFSSVLGVIVLLIIVGLWVADKYGEI